MAIVVDIDIMPMPNFSSLDYCQIAGKAIIDELSKDEYMKLRNRYVKNKFMCLKQE